MGLFRRNSHLPPIENYPGYEASDLAFINAIQNVELTIKRLNSPIWAIQGTKNFNKYLKVTKSKLPDKEFNFLINQKELIWEAFRTFLLKPENYGKWNSETYTEIYRDFISAFSQMPKGYKPEGKEWVEAAGLMLDSLNDALIMDRQILAQPIIEYVLIIWLHYCINQEN